MAEACRAGRTAARRDWLALIRAPEAAALTYLADALHVAVVAIRDAREQGRALVAVRPAAFGDPPRLLLGPPPAPVVSILPFLSRREASHA